MSYPGTPIAGTTADPWAEFPDADTRGLLTAPAATLGDLTRPRSGAAGPLAASPWGLDPSGAVIGQSSYPSPALAGEYANRFGMFGRGPAHMSGASARSASALSSGLSAGLGAPDVAFQPYFTAPNLNLGGLQLRPTLPTRTWTDDTGKEVFIDRGDGFAEVRSNDNGASWRDNNPGNMKAGNYTRNWGQIGVNTKCQTCGSPGFAIMPDQQSGYNAMIDSLTNNSIFDGLGVDGIARKWANLGPGPHSYIDQIHKFTGWPTNFAFDRSDPGQVRTLANAIVRAEGWRPGQVDSYNTQLPDGLPLSQ